jgi:Ca-activated chloride channel family protein
VTAAGEAAARRLRVYTIGFGSTAPAAAVCTPEQLGGDAVPGSFGVPGSVDPAGAGVNPGVGTGGVAPRRFRELDEETLTAVAELTGGAYYRAEEADQLRDIFDALPSQIELQHEEREVTVWFTLGGVALAVAAVTLSLLWNRLPSSG